MSRIDLTGLQADLPLSAMAAFGCLRVCERRPELRGTKLGWEGREGTYHAALWTTGECSRETLVAALVEDVRQAAGRPELAWRDQIKTAGIAEFRPEAQKAIETATANDREAADWFAAFGSELELDREGRVEPTPFDMSVARQRFLADALRLAAGLAQDRAKRKTAVESYTEALFGPWMYEDDQHSLGWDPSTIKLGAFTSKAPTGMANAGVRAAVWLAFESLPLFPCFYSAARPKGLRVRGFQRERREFALYWPVWKGAIGIDALGTLLGETAGAGESLLGRGVIAVYRSERFKPNKYLFSFRTPELAAGTFATNGV